MNTGASAVFQSKTAQRTAQLMVAIMLFAGCATRHIEQKAAAPETAFHQITVGLCEDYPEESRSLVAARNDLLLLKTNHIPVLRIAFGWDAMEPERGKFDWTFWDDFVRTANDFGVRLIPYICYTPQWASSDKGTNFWRGPPKDTKDFADFVSHLVRRYKGTIHSWELWNEPDNPAYWSGSLEQLAALLKAGSHAVRDADPTAKVVCGGIAWNVDFLRQLFEDHGIGRYVDVVNVHNYNETWSPDPLERIFDIAGNTKRVIRRFGSNQPIWFAEVGYSDYRKGDYVSGIYHAQFGFEHTPAFQSVSLGRAISTAAANGNVSTFAWYRIHDLPEQQDIIGDVNNRHLGVLTTKNQVKPALACLVFFNKLFSQPVRCIDAEVQCLRRIQSDVEVHLFERQDKTVFAVAWLRAIPRRSDINFKEHDRREEAFDLVLPTAPAGTAIATDGKGDAIRTLKVQHRDGASELRGIRIRDGELIVIQLQPKASLSVHTR